jgi:hypothetical protein
MSKLLFPAAAILLPTIAFADGGSIPLRREAGDLAITVFTSPVPLSVGPADISLLIQNRNGLDPVLDADVRLVLHNEPSSIEFQAHPTRALAKNKLLYAAPVIFAKPGKWQITVVVMHHGNQTSVNGTFEVRSAPPRAVSYAGYIALPPVLVTLFLIREGLIRRKSRV